MADDIPAEYITTDLDLSTEALGDDPSPVDFCIKNLRKDKKLMGYAMARNQVDARVDAKVAQAQAAAQSAQSSSSSANSAKQQSLTAADVAGQKALVATQAADTVGAAGQHVADAVKAAETADAASAQAAKANETALANSQIVMQAAQAAQASSRSAEDAAQAATEKSQQMHIVGNSSEIGHTYQRTFQGFTRGHNSSGAYRGGVGDFHSSKIIDNAVSDRVHFRLPWKVDTDSKMFHLHFKGHAFRSQRAIDFIAVGYCYKPISDITYTGVTGSSQFDTEVYAGDDAHVYIRVDFDQIYYMTLSIDSMAVGNGPAILPGQIVAVLDSGDRVTADGEAN